MKQSRRHELKTNELSIWLHQAYAAAGRHVNYIIGGVVVVVLILVVAFYVQNRRHQGREEAWSRYYELLGTRPSEKPDVIDQARRFAEEHTGDSELGPRSQLMVAHLSANYGAELDPLKEGPKRLALLKQARDYYMRVIQEYAGQTDLVAQARVGLAPVLESLVVLGEATRDDVLKQYQALQQEGRYQKTAKEMANTLDERLKPLNLVATRPAATAPATQTATQPSPATIPAVPVPATEPATTGTVPAE